MLPWDPLFAARSPLFDPLRAISMRLAQPSWPTRRELSALAHELEVVNASRKPIVFREPQNQVRSARGYELRIAHTGEVEFRDANWHDLFNALVWMTFPRAKAALNARHVASLDHESRLQRGPVRDALTQFDEDGIVVVSERADLLELLKGFRWRELFWQRRAEIQSQMRWFVFGHAHYEKALQPFVGLTAKALSVLVEPNFCVAPYARQLQYVDGAIAQTIAASSAFTSPRALHPMPVLGIPGWSTQSRHASFYEDATYFRPGRRGMSA